MLLSAGYANTSAKVWNAAPEINCVVCQLVTENLSSWWRNNPWTECVEKLEREGK